MKGQYDVAWITYQKIKIVLGTSKYTLLQQDQSIYCCYPLKFQFLFCGIYIQGFK